jgi:hypothetical protein
MEVAERGGSEATGAAMEEREVVLVHARLAR